MKKIIALLLLVGMVSPVFAQDAAQDITATLGVTGAFSMTILQGNTLNLGTVGLAGGAASNNGTWVTCVVNTNHNMDWYLQGWMDNFAGPGDMPEAVFEYSWPSDITGTEIPAFGTWAPVPLASANLFEAEVESLRNLVAGEFAFQTRVVGVPAGLPAGSYTTTLHLNLHDAAL